MTITSLIILILVCVLACILVGFLIGLKFKRYRIRQSNSNTFLDNYYEGLNYLIAEKPDDAIDVFVNLLQVDSSTVDLHLSLGNLFRRQGELERATRVHQNLIARPQLSKEYKAQALSALAQDYYQAGVLDRAERLFSELISNKAEILSSSNYLLKIYQKEKEWDKAVEMAKKIQTISTIDLRRALAHYHCELAELANKQGDLKTAKILVKKAGQIDSACVRVTLMEAELTGKDYHKAIQSYRKLAKQDPLFINEVLAGVCECYRNLNDPEGLIELLDEFLALKPTAKLAETKANSLSHTDGINKATDYMASCLDYVPQLEALKVLSGLAMKASHGEAKKRFEAVEKAVSAMCEKRPSYQCNDCGYASQLFYWLCPSCQTWEKIKPIT